MTLPEPPLPTVRQLVQALFPLPLGEGRVRVEGSAISLAHWYGTASEALAAAIHASVDAGGSHSPAVWFPAYFCNDALRFVRLLPVDLKFYDVEPDLGIHWDRFDRLLQSSQSASTLVLVHYFGFPNQTEVARTFCRRRNITLVEDAAHAVTGVPGIGGSNAVVFSPRKLLAVPAGGLLLADEKLRGFVPEPGQVDPSWGVLPWVFRRLIQSGLTKAGVPWHFLPAYRRPSTIESEIPSAGRPTACQPYIRNLIAVAERELPAVIAKRRLHFGQLLNWCRGLTDIEPMFENLPGGVCPYVFPVRIKRDPGWFVDFFRSRGVPASRWPDLPPETQSVALFPQSMRLGQHTVLLPVHQTLTDRQVEKMGRILRLAVESHP